MTEENKEEPNAMKLELIELVKKMTEDNYDFFKTPAMFKWYYEDTPEVDYILIIKGREKKSVIITPNN